MARRSRPVGRQPRGCEHAREETRSSAVSPGLNGRRGSMGTSFRDCACSILNAREEKLLDDEGRVQVRLICSRCGAILDSEVLPVLRRGSEPSLRAHEQEAEAD